ncbi:ROK family protein [Microbacterium sp. NPDC057659]|uniref:ROK family protein n=1 Tax=Microbacterium sp. NPDC057659 TaxID=3346198 RepID=UPI0036718BD3
MELCIDFGGTEIKLAVIDGRQVLASRAIPVRGDTGDLAAAADAARGLIAGTGTPTAAGIAVPGVVEPTTGRMLHANAKYDFLRGLDLQDWSRTALGLPAVIENDARAALVGEAEASGERDVVLVTLGTGIGTAAMIGGVALRGRSGHAGILGGHATTDIHGPICPCGNLGCAEALASSWALGEQHDGLTVRDLFESDAHHDLRDRFLQVWGATVVTLTHMYDPAAVILSGGILRAGDAVREPIETYVHAHLWPSITPPRFTVPPEPELSVARGLAVLARGTTHHDQEDQ